MDLINNEINLISTWSANQVIKFSAIYQAFGITDTKIYLPVVTLLKVVALVVPKVNSVTQSV